MSPVRDVPESRPKGSELRVGEPLEAGAWKIRPVVRVGDGRGPGVSLRAELAEVIVPSSGTMAKSIVYLRQTEPVPCCGAWPALP
jgi:hypothetical protein